MADGDTKQLEQPTEKAKDLGGSEARREVTTREAYFASLEAWVKNANISQNAMAMFPWYLMQMFQTQAAGGFGAGMPTPMPGGLGGVVGAGGGSASGSGSGYGGVSTTQAAFQQQQQQQQQQQPQQQQHQTPGANMNVMNAGLVNGLAQNRFMAGLHIMDIQEQGELISRTGAYEYVIAPFWKRAIAEVIDMFILLILKIFLTFVAMTLLDLDWAIDLDKEVLRKAIDEEDYAGFLVMSLDFLAFSSDLILLEVLMKLMVCVYEAYCMKIHACTVGKAIMNLRVYYVEAVLLVPPQPQAQQAPPAPPVFGFHNPQRSEMLALIYPAEKPNFKRGLMRALAKNLIIALLFPMCFIMVFFKNNRAIYDIITKTVVVEDNPQAQLRQLRTARGL